MFFLVELINDDKLTFGFGFNFTDTPYSFVNKNPLGVGIAAEFNDTMMLCSNTMGQRHPTTGQINSRTGTLISEI